MDSSYQGEDSFLTKFSDTLTKFLDPKLEWAKKTWNKWDLKAIFLLSMTLQLILLILGRRRSRITKAWVRFIIWSSYLMASWIATIGIGMLSGSSVDDPYIPNTETTLKALLAPLFLLHLGNPDTITAYSIEDNQLGIRGMFEATAQIGLVIWVLFKCWTYTKLSFLTIPMFCVGLVKYAERVWSLWYALKEDVDVMIKEKEIIPKLVEGLSEENSNVSLILEAYYRFDHLKPHLENWVYRPYYLHDGALSKDDSAKGKEKTDNSEMLANNEPYNSEKMFKVTEIELGFMYDALYTKSPLLYSRVGFVLRFLAFIGIVLTFCGFALLYKPTLHQTDITFTYAVLLVAISVELYSDARLLFTDRAIVWMMINRFPKIQLLRRLVRFLAWLSERKKRWSNHLYQFNILTFCLKTRRRSLMTKFLRLCRLDERWEKHIFKGEIEVCDQLKVLVLEKVHNWKPFTKCGNLSLKPRQSSHDTNLHEHNKDDIVHCTTFIEFGRSVAIWHLATNLCYYMDGHQGPSASDACKKRKVSKVLSDYMMHLLVNMPEMLSAPSGPIIFKRLREVLTILLDSTPSAEQSSPSTQKEKDERWACEHLLQVNLKENKQIKCNDPMDQLDRSIFPEAKELVQKLSEDNSKWDLMLSMWVEKLCYAVDNCTLYSHAKQLRRGGEFITSIWLLIYHNKTDPSNIAPCV